MKSTAKIGITESVFGSKRSAATNLGATLVAALAERDFDRLTGVLAPDVRMRALIPPGLVEVVGGDAAAARFASWFGASDGLELAHFNIDEVGDRLDVCYRLRVKKPGAPWKVVEQHLFGTLDNGRIAAFDLVCSGFRLGEVTDNPREGAETDASTPLRSRRFFRVPRDEELAEESKSLHSAWRNLKRLAATASRA